MSLLRHPAGAMVRALLATAGTLAAVGFSAWPVATACFAALSALALAEARARAREAEHRGLPSDDPHTGVASARALHEHLHEATAADPQRFALLTLDVDSLKEINAAHGPLEGDRLLQQVGRVLREHVGEGEIVARQGGGDELSVLIPDADEDGAAMLARRIEEALGSIASGDHAPVRASIGVAVYRRDDATPTDRLAKADVEPRRGKQRGRAELSR